MELNREQIRAIIYYEWLDTKESREIHGRITRRLEDNSVSISTVKYWLREFRFGRDSLKDEQRSGRPVEATTDKNIATI
jgi:histone-lysine N-methyltransferase SETMAR